MLTWRFTSRLIAILCGLSFVNSASAEEPLQVKPYFLTPP